MAPARSCLCGTCPTCRNRARMRTIRRRQAYGQWTPRLVDVTGTRRRLQALQVIGWTAHSIGQHLNVTSQRVTAIINDPRPNVHTTTAQRISALYDRLSMTPGTSRRTRERAAAKGWHRPLCWDDDQIDNPEWEPDGCCGPQRPKRLPDNLAELAARILEHGTRATAERYGVTQGTLTTAMRRGGWTNTAPPGTAARYQPPASAGAA